MPHRGVGVPGLCRGGALPGTPTPGSAGALPGTPTPGLCRGLCRGHPPVPPPHRGVGVPCPTPGPTPPHRGGSAGDTHPGLCRGLCRGHPPVPPPHRGVGVPCPTPGPTPPTAGLCRGHPPVPCPATGGWVSHAEGPMRRAPGGGCPMRRACASMPLCVKWQPSARNSGPAIASVSGPGRTFGMRSGRLCWASRMRCVLPAAGSPTPISQRVATAGKIGASMPRPGSDAASVPSVDAIHSRSTPARAMRRVASMWVPHTSASERPGCRSTRHLSSQLRWYWPGGKRPTPQGYRAISA